jgi:lipopolysaccharide/colanic/teichoic acid biosynthesis glycosyltransferase
VGRLLRRTGADELPQLLDVLKGRMSLVGPRPLPVESDAFSERDGERHLVRPGMTGLWQVSGGSTLRYREMIDLDLAYVHGWSPWLDLQVLLATVGVLVRATLSRDGRAS